MNAPYRTPSPRSAARALNGGIPVLMFFARAVPPGARISITQMVGRQAVAPYRLCFGETCAPHFRLMSLTDHGSDVSMVGQLPDEGVECRAFPYMPPADRNVVAPWRNVVDRHLYQMTYVMLNVLNASSEPRDMEAVLYGEFIGAQT